MAGLAANQKIQLGKEATKGTPVAATTVWRGGYSAIEDAHEVIEVADKPGIAIPTDRQVAADLFAKLDMPAEAATFEQLPYILNAGIKGVTGSQDGAGTDYIYAYPVGLTSVQSTYAYTIESGDDVEVEEMEYSQVEKFTLAGGRKELIKMGATWFGRQPTVSAFTGALSVPTVEEILTDGTIYIDDTSSAYGTTALSAGQILRFSLTVTTGIRPVWTIDSGQLYFYESIFDRDSFEATLEMTWRHTSDANDEKDAWRAGTSRLIRLEFQGSAVGTPGTVYSYKTLLIDICGKWQKFNPIEAEDGNSIVTATFKCGYNETAAEGLTITVVNELAALP